MCTIPHIQGIHDTCHRNSFCQSANYVPMKVQLIKAYEKFLQSTSLYCYAKLYCRVGFTCLHL